MEYWRNACPTLTEETAGSDGGGLSFMVSGGLCGGDLEGLAGVLE